MKKSLLFGGIVLLCLTSCTNKINSISDSQESYRVETTQYNEDMKVLAGALHQALSSSSSFASKVKTEALKCFDGDVDVLLKDITPQIISISTKNGDRELSVGEYLSEFIPQTKSGGESLIDFLQETYPLLQIAIPVHAEEWDGITVPKIAFVPENNIESEKKPIPAIDEDGQWILMSATEEPKEPVIVLSLNERSSNYVVSSPSLPAPINLTAQAVNDYIDLSWTAVPHVSFYRIYRKSPADSDFVYHGTSSSPFYNDYSLKANTVYYYCVKSVIKYTSNGQAMEHMSEASDIVRVQAPSIPANLEYFDVLCQGSHIEFRWNDDGIPDSRVKISSKVPSTESSYSLLADQLSSDCNYSYNSPVKGERVVYMARRQTHTGLSNPSYNFVYPPYRNTAESSPIRVTSISIKNLNDVEAWYSGAPEFYVKVFKPSYSNGTYTTYEASSQIKLAFSSRTNSQSFNKVLYNWLVEAALNWRDAVQIYMIEGDNDKSYSFSAKVTVPICDYVALDLSYSTSQTLNSNFNTSGQYCGFDNLYYFDNPTKTLSYGYGVTMTVTE